MSDKLFIEVDNPLDPNTALGKVALQEDQNNAALMDEGGVANQLKLRATAFKSPEVLSALRKAFSGQCAYCHAPLPDVSDGHVTHYRPAFSVLEDDSHPGYWWLVNKWENLLLVCSGCLGAKSPSGGYIEKGGSFPIGDSSSRQVSPNCTTAEDPMLLNPRMDSLADHISYDALGFANGATPQGLSTISIMNLNRNSLLEQRDDQIALFQHRFDQWFLEDVGDIEGNVRLENGRETWDVGLTTLAEGLAFQPVVIAFRAALLDQLVDFYNQPKDYYDDQTPQRSSCESIAINSNNLRQVFRHISQIEVRNLRSVKLAKFRVSSETSEAAPWTMFLGENGTGKTSILQAIALTLAGPNYALTLIGDALFDPWSLLGEFEDTCQIFVSYEGRAEPAILKINSDEMTFSLGEVSQTLHREEEYNSVDWSETFAFVAFSASRILASDTGVVTGERPPSTVTNVQNLFAPHVPLKVDYSFLVNESYARSIEIILAELLELPRASVSADKQGISLIIGGRELRLAQLSSGYQTISVIVLEVLRSLSVRFANFRNAEGVVLIDELEAHLHPKWQLRIVSTLKKALPGVQFITTTHQPLCLRGLDPSEIIVLQRLLDETLSISDLPGYDGLKVDQLLKSELFSMHSTDTPEIEALYAKYQKLLESGDSFENPSMALHAVVGELDKIRAFGDTRRDRLVNQAVDLMLAKRRAQSPKEPDEKFLADIVEVVSKAWADASEEAFEDD